MKYSFDGVFQSLGERWRTAAERSEVGWYGLLGVFLFTLFGPRNLGEFSASRCIQLPAGEIESWLYLELI